MGPSVISGGSQIRHWNHLFLSGSGLKKSSTKKETGQMHDKYII